MSTEYVVALQCVWAAIRASSSWREVKPIGGPCPEICEDRKLGLGKADHAVAARQLGVDVVEPASPILVESLHRGDPADIWDRDHHDAHTAQHER